MKRKGDSAKLKDAIALLESQQRDKGKILKDGYHETVDSIKPSNILKNTLNQVTTPSFIIEKALNAAVGLIGGYLSKKIAVGSSHSKLRKLIGTVVQFEVSNLIAKHPEMIKTIGLFIFERVIKHKKKHVKLVEEQLSDV